jgi:hypothetical protein
MNFKKIALVFAGIVLAAALWLRWWLQPERQIPRAQARLLSAIERRDFDTFSALIAPAYRDRWEHDKAVVVARSREVFGQFATLTIMREARGLRSVSGAWLLSEKITVSGIGGPLAMTARDTVNGLRAPFVMEWRQRSAKPWDWELHSVANPELEIP